MASWCAPSAVAAPKTENSPARTVCVPVLMDCYFTVCCPAFTADAMFPFVFELHFYPLLVCISFSVADASNSRVQVLLASDGSHVRTFGSHGPGAAQFSRVRGVCLSTDDQFLFVADQNNQRVQILRASDGELVRSITTVEGGASLYVAAFSFFFIAALHASCLLTLTTCSHFFIFTATRPRASPSPATIFTYARCHPPNCSVCLSEIL